MTIDKVVKIGVPAFALAAAAAVGYLVYSSSPVDSDNSDKEQEPYELRKLREQGM
jgi:hypothetical protein